MQVSAAVNASEENVDACSSAARMVSWDFEERWQKILSKMIARITSSVIFLQMATSSKDMQKH